MKGKIIKAISGFYYIHTAGGLWTCRARGILRTLGIHPMVGDQVEFDPVLPEKMEGNLTRVCERKNILIRPAAANIDQALIVFAVREPDPSFNLLDRFLIYMEMQEIPVVVYFNKTDLDSCGISREYRSIYEKAGCRVLAGSVKEEKSVAEILEVLKGRTTVLAGPSGVGKSSLTNRLYEKAGMEVGELSEKIKRGRQTTRHTELFAVDAETFFLDTPGFTSLYVQGVPSDKLRYYFEEFAGPAQQCRFAGCSHVNEPEAFCGVRRAVSTGNISRIRYEDYCQIYREIRDAEQHHQY